MVDKLTPHEYQLIVQATDNLTANKIQQGLNAASSVGTVTSVNSGTGITVDNTDPANPIINYSGASGDVSGGASSTDGEIARYNLATGKVIKASATPVIVSDLGDITLPAGQTVFSNTFRSISSGNTSLLADSGGEVIINDSGNNTPNAIGIDMSGTGGYVKFKDGAAAGVAFGNSATNGVIFGVNTVSIVTNGVEKWMVNSSGALNPIASNTYDIGGATSIRDIGIGRNAIVGGIVSAAVGAMGAPSYTFTGNLTTGFYQVSATQIGVAVAGALQATFDSVIGGMAITTIGELIGGVGVAFPNDIHANSIVDNGGNMLIANTFSTGFMEIQTLDNYISIESGNALTLQTSDDSDLAIVIDGSGNLVSNGKTGVTGMTLAAAIAAGDKIIVNGIVCEP